MNLTFLNAAFLLGAFAALLPLLIHLFSRRRVETVDFSSLRFLKELERRKIRRVRVRQILLLIVRSLIILCVAVALARPTLTGTLGAIGGHARTSVAIVLDRSASMSRRSLAGAGDATLLQNAVEVADEVAGLLDEGDQAFLVTAVEPPQELLPGGTFSRTTLLDAIGDMEESAQGTDYSGAVESGLEALAGARNLNRELYVIGDLQRTGWDGAMSAGWSGQAFEGDLPTAYFFPVEGPIGNVGVSNVAIERRYGGAEGLHSVVAEVANSGARSTDVPVRLFIDGVQVGRGGVDLGPGETGVASFSVSVDERVWHAGRIEIPSDALESDNARFFAVPPAGRTEVLVVAGDGAGATDAYYAARALDPDGEGRTFRTYTVESSELPAQEQARFPVVVLADVGRLGDAASRWLREHVSGGGGLVVILGDATDIRSWNEGAVPGSGSITLVEPFSSASGVRLKPSSHGHPLLEGLAFGERLIDEIGVTRGFVADAPGVEEVLEFPGLGPALLLPQGVASGKAGGVAVLLTGLDPEWSDLPRSGFVVPLMHRLVRYVAGGGARTSTASVGGDLVVPVPGESPGQVEVTLPDGSVSSPELVSGRRTSVVLRAVALPGVYRFTRDGSTVALGTVNVDAAESDLAAADREDIARLLPGIRCRWVEPGEDVGERVLESRRGRELWRVFVYVALALLALEMFLARVRTA